MKTSMFTRVCASLVIGAGVIFAANGETKKWVGGDGYWKDAAMWSPSGVPASTDDVIIENGKVEYVPEKVDLKIDAGATLTIGNGGTFVQSNEESWIQLKGAIVVKSGGTFDMGSCYKVNADTTTASITVEKGGTFIKQNAGKEQTGTLPILILGEGTNYWSGAKICTWTGNAGDGKWLTAGNWDVGEVPAAIDDVVIPEGKTVEYVPDGADLTIWGSLTIKKGAKVSQPSGEEWIQVYGTIVIEDGATLDHGTSKAMNMHDGWKIYVKEGGVLPWFKSTYSTASWGKVGYGLIEGTLKWEGASTVEITLTQLQQLMSLFKFSETGRFANLPAVQFTGTLEMDLVGAMDLTGFTAQKTGASGAREDNELVLKSGKYIVRADGGHKPRGIVVWAPCDTDACKTWVSFPDRSKAEVVLTHTDVTGDAEVIADPYNVYTYVKDCVHATDATVYNLLYCRGEQILDLASFKKAFTVWQDTEGVHMKLKNPTGLVIRVQ